MFQYYDTQGTGTIIIIIIIIIIGITSQNQPVTGEQGLKEVHSIFGYYLLDE